MVESNINRCIYIIAGFLTFVYAITFSIFPLAGEDFALTKRFINHDLITRISYSIERSSRQIEIWNARLGEQLAIFNLSMPPLFFIFISIISFLVISYIFFRIFSDGSKGACLGTCISIIVIYAFWPGFEVFFWKTANAGYLQPMIITLAVLLIYINDSLIENIKIKFYYIYLMACILAGLSFENVPVALLIAMALYCFINNTVSIKRLMPMLFVLAGWVAIILAPSTGRRKEFYQHALNYNGMSIDYIMTRMIDVVTVFVTTSWFLLLISSISFGYLIYTKKTNIKIWLCIVSAILVDGSMIMSPYTEARAFMFSWCIMTAVIVRSITLLISQQHKSSKIIFLAVVLFSVPSSLLTLKASVAYASQDSFRESMIESARYSGLCKDGVNVNRISTPYTYRYVNNREHWFFGNLDQVSVFYDCHIKKQ